VTESDIKQVFENLSESEFWLPAKKITTDSFASVIVIIFVLLFTLITFFVGIYTKAITLTEIVFYPFLTIPCIGISYCLISYYQNTNSTGIEYLANRQDDFGKILRNLNKEKFLKKGVRWEAGENGAWIELQLLKVKKEVGDFHRNLEKEIEKEINEELCNEMYLAGIEPTGKKSWSDF